MLFHFQPLSGFHATEQDALGPFVWTEGRFTLRAEHAARFARARLCYYGDAGKLQVANPQGPVDEIDLGRGWQDYPIRLGDTDVDGELHFTLSPVIHVPGDSRELGLMLRSLELFDDEARYARLRDVARNLQQNQREFAAGNTILSSTPPQLRVNMEVRCNIPETGPACVYCAWDWAKAAERDYRGFTPETWDELEGFYRAAVEIVDCSIGEPTMNKYFGVILSRVDADEKQMSLTTNGQLLTPARRRELLGKNLNVYCSLDSATAHGYARFRNDRFERIVGNLRALCAEKRAFGNLPRVYVSFIVMRSNLDELPEFLRLMQDVGVDEIKLRALYLDENVGTAAHPAAKHFDYEQEIVPLADLLDLTPRVQEMARVLGVPLYVEWEQFAADVTQEGQPLCSEPWKTMYVLGRGIMPCCYATEPLATWSQQQQRPLETFLADVFNGPAYQEIRARLAEGELAEYCLRTPSCPILKQSQAEGHVETTLNAYQRRALQIDDTPVIVSLEDWRTRKSKAA